MFWRSKRRPGPTGTGRIVENINWYFWDDAKQPGQIHRNKFATLRKMALSEADFSGYVLASTLANDTKAIAEVEKYHAKVGAYLARMRDNRPEALGYWLDSTWDGTDTEEGLLLLKAHFNVLRDWGYPFAWRDAYDARGYLTMVIVSKSASRTDRAMRSLQSPFRNLVAPPNEIEYCVHRDEIVRITGRPQEFTVDFRDAVWKFNYATGDLVVT